MHKVLMLYDASNLAKWVDGVRFSVSLQPLKYCVSHLVGLDSFRCAFMQIFQTSTVLEHTILCVCVLGVRACSTDTCRGILSKVFSNVLILSIHRSVPLSRDNRNTQKTHTRKQKRLKHIPTNKHTQIHINQQASERVACIKVVEYFTHEYAATNYAQVTALMCSNSVRTVVGWILDKNARYCMTAIVEFLKSESHITRFVDQSGHLRNRLSRPPVIWDRR